MATRGACAAFPEFVVQAFGLSPEKYFVTGRCYLMREGGPQVLRILFQLLITTLTTLLAIPLYIFALVYVHALYLKIFIAFRAHAIDLRSSQCFNL